ncbi:uncharacterized protein LOC111914254 [Lactuca sativa]|uniref:uncharacterized protein LOC111914254 n=1 Tax=Lactuca sativa TaxID=4236 RepID=UPI0022AFAA7B|nr:uncharacterized protein LOC111914254 [Lactuca sativa]
MLERNNVRRKKNGLGLQSCSSANSFIRHSRPPAASSARRRPPTASINSPVSSLFFDMNSIIDMIDNDDFSIISQAVVITNMMNIDNELELNENLEDEIGEENDEEAPFDNNVEVPSTFTNMEGTNLNIDDNRIGLQSTSKNDFTRELGKDSFKDKEELVRAIKIHCIRAHREFEVIDSHPTILTLRCKLYLQYGCKWKLHASKRKRSGYFEITTYIGLHACLHYKLSQDHPNLDASLIAMETRHLIKAQPSISIPALRVEIVETLGYTPSYKKVWVGKQKAIEHVFGNWESLMSLYQNI